jgi:hypothetical protein
MGSINETMKVAFVTPVKNPIILTPYIVFGIFNSFFIYAMVNWQNELSMSGSIILLLIWSTISFIFLVFIPPLFESWLYSLIVDYFLDKKLSLSDRFYSIIKRYFGFLGLQALFSLIFMIFCIPLIILYLLAFTSTYFSPNFSMTGLFMTIGIFLFIFYIVIIFLTSFFAYMKPIYTYSNRFLFSIREGFIMTKSSFTTTLFITVIIFIICIPLSIPSLIEIFKTSFSSMHYHLWQATLSSIQSLIFSTIYACAFTHLYLTFRKELETPSASQQQDF